MVRKSDCYEAHQVAEQGGIATRGQIYKGAPIGVV